MNECFAPELQEKIGYVFRDKSLLETALTHSSYANENKDDAVGCNERLEFLGDSILGMKIAKLIFMKYPDMPEGKMSKLRAELVCEKSLAEVAVRLELGKCLRLGRGEEKNGGRIRPSILADAVEALLAAVYIDGSADEAERLVTEIFMAKAESLRSGGTDHKTALQEMVQVKSGQTLRYNITGERGPDHMKSFFAEVRLNDKVIGSGSGPTKKEAEQNAAGNALSLRKDEREQQAYGAPCGNEPQE